jgi:hypothetical protein
MHTESSRGILKTTTNPENSVSELKSKLTLFKDHRQYESSNIYNEKALQTYRSHNL